MPVNLEFQWNGQAVIDQFSRQALSAMQKAGIEGERTAQGLARVRTGFMRDSVYVIAEPTADGWVLVIGDSAPYAVFNELGTAFMSAQPFIRPGGDRAASLLLELLAREGPA